MKSKALALAGVAIAALSVTGCSTIGKAAGVSKKTPDEFNVVTKAPLVVPPEYGLRPPATGAELPTELDPGVRGRTILFGQDLGQTASAGEKALVAAAGATAADADIRTRVDFADAAIIRKNNSIVDQVMNFVPLSNTKTDANGTPLDAEAEARRLKQIETVTSATGGADVVIRRESGGFKLPGT